MTYDTEYMQRCLQLAQLGLGNVQPNPMVGAVVVHNNRIIGEGYHQKYGQPHAEVNAIQSVADKSLLKDSTLYVSLEPCSHFGKTPPCADLIIDCEIPRVVVGATDPNSKVNGQGILKLKNAGIEVITNVLDAECRFLNRRFFTYHQKKRPYIILKWAQSADKYMDIDRSEGNKNYWITNAELKVVTHKWRSEEQAILIGYNTLVNDNPQLTTREYTGKDPIRYVMTDLKRSYAIPNGFNPLSNNINESLMQLYNDKIQSVIVEGGRKTLDLFIQSGIWDEARVLTGEKEFGKGTPAPQLLQPIAQTYNIHNNLIHYYYNV